MTTIAVDTSALLAVLLDEAEAETMVSIMSGRTTLISASTLVEARVVARARLGTAGRRQLDSLLRKVHAEVVPFDEHQADVASEAYRDYGRGSGHPAKLNYGDCFSYALASVRGVPLLYKGDDFGHTDLRSALQG